MLHGILYVREIYPQGAFDRRKAYGIPVQVDMLQIKHFLLWHIVLIAFKSFCDDSSDLEWKFCYVLAINFIK